MVGVQGRIQTRSFTTQDGQQRQVYEVVADRVAFLESKAERERREARQQAAGAQAPPPPPAPPEVSEAGPEPLDITDADDPFGDQ
jgi:single-strand DNA-binding protein